MKKFLNFIESLFFKSIDLLFDSIDSFVFNSVVFLFGSIDFFFDSIALIESFLKKIMEQFKNNLKKIIEQGKSNFKKIIEEGKKKIEQIKHKILFTKEQISDFFDSNQLTELGYLRPDFEERIAKKKLKKKIARFIRWRTFNIGFIACVYYLFSRDLSLEEYFVFLASFWFSIYLVVYINYIIIRYIEPYESYCILFIIKNEISEISEEIFLRLLDELDIFYTPLYNCTVTLYNCTIPFLSIFRSTKKKHKDKEKE